jgi:hypothetical protein
MQAHEKWLAGVLVVAVLAAVTAPHWLPPPAPAAPRAKAPLPAEVDFPNRRAPLPPFDPASFAQQLRTRHYAISTNATEEQTQHVAESVEALHAAYAEFFGARLTPLPEGTRLQLALYRDRADFQAHNTSRAWAEGYYRKPVCHAYYDTRGANPVHWMLHEATHQLDTEWSRFPRTPWVGEGLASYFGTSRLQDGKLLVGEVDPGTYPIWWLDTLSGDREADIAMGKLVSLRELVESDGPQEARDVNAYYIGYWSLAHYLMHGDGGRHAAAFRAMVEHGGSLADFEKQVGPVDQVEARWYAHLLGQRDALGAQAVGGPRR